MFRAIPIDERPGLFGQFGRWFRARSRRRARLAELDGYGRAEMEHMPRDLGMSRGNFLFSPASGRTLRICCLGGWNKSIWRVSSLRFWAILRECARYAEASENASMI